MRSEPLNMNQWDRSLFPLPHCEPQSPFLGDLSSFVVACIPTWDGFTSTLLGNLSIIAWLCAQLPQVYKNYRLQSTTGLSVYFLVEWLLGDTTNLVGAILTHQATWQVFLASYYTIVDIVLVCQYIYYTRVRLRKERGSASTEDHAQAEPDQSTSLSEDLPQERRREPDSDRATVNRDPVERGRNRPYQNLRLPGSVSSPQEKSATTTDSARSDINQASVSAQKGFPKTLLMVSMLCVAVSHASPLPRNTASAALEEDGDFTKEAIGRTVSWLSAFLYLGSRVPQIYKNQVRRSTAGLSPALFIAAFLGNLFYSSSLLSNPLAWHDYPPYGGYGWAPPDGSNHVDWVAAATPFFLGAAGVLVMDLTIGIQFLAFGEPREEAKVVVEDPRAEGHWQKVSGWMRGWVPSPTPGQTSFGPVFDRTSDDERPLLQRGSSLDSSRQYGIA